MTCYPFIAYDAKTNKKIDNAKPSDILSGRVYVLFKTSCDKEATIKLANFTVKKAGAKELYSSNDEYYIVLENNGFKIDVQIPFEQVEIMALSAWSWLTPDKQLKSIQAYMKNNKITTKNNTEETSDSNCSDEDVEIKEEDLKTVDDLKKEIGLKTASELEEEKK